MRFGGWPNGITLRIMPRECPAVVDSAVLRVYDQSLTFTLPVTHPKSTVHRGWAN